MSITPAPASDWIDQVASAYGRGQPLALLFDYDGTLTPIVRHPSLARLSLIERARLRRLAAMPDVRLGVISGRALAEVRSLVGLEGVYYAGSGGLEIDLLGEVRRSKEVATGDVILSAIEDQLLDLLRKFPGTWLERKPGALAIHYRGLLPLAATCFRYEATELLAVVAELRSRVVSDAIEVTPAEGWDKGSAVIAILAHIEENGCARPLPVYFGDAANDAEGMVVVTHSGGVSVGVGPDAPPVAQERLAGTAELTEVLRELIARLAAARRLSSPNPAPLPTAGPAPPVRGEPGSVVGGGDGLLIVDPDAGFRRRVSSELTDLGWRVWQADTPESASAQMREHGAATRVVLVDLQLPGLQGARTLSELGQSRQDIVRCVMSADISPYTAAAFGRLSDIPLFVKPFRARELDSALRSFLAAGPGSVG